MFVKKFSSTVNRMSRPSVLLVVTTAAAVPLAIGVAVFSSDSSEKNKPKPGRQVVNIQSTVKPKIQASTTKTPSAKERWSIIAPKLCSADRQRQTTLNANTASLRASLSSLITDAGMETFIDEVLSLGSKVQMVADPDEHQKWVREMFVTHVFPEEEIRQIILAKTTQLSTELAKVDNETLISIQADVELDPGKLKVSTIDSRKIDGQVDLLITDLHSTIDQSMARSISSFFFGAAGFEAGRQISRSAIADDNGEVSLLGELFSWGIGFVAEEVTRSISDELLQTRQTIAADLRTAANQLLNHVVAGPIQTERQSAVRQHQLAVFNSVTTSLGVDRNWAAENYR